MLVIALFLVACVRTAYMDAGSDSAQALSPCEADAPSGTVSASATMVDFEDVEIGTASATLVVLTSIGDEPAYVCAVSVPDGPFTVVAPTRLPARLVPEAELGVQVAFVPEEAGDFEAILTIETSDEAGTNLAVTLTGTGTP